MAPALPSPDQQPHHLIQQQSSTRHPPAISPSSSLRSSRLQIARNGYQQGGLPASYPSHPQPAALRDSTVIYQHHRQPSFPRSLHTTQQQRLQSRPISSERVSRASDRHASLTRSARWPSDSSPDSLRYDEEKEICVVPAPARRHVPSTPQDPEKVAYDGFSNDTSQDSLHQISTYEEDDDDDAANPGRDDRRSTRKATLKALLHLSACNPILSFGLMCYTIFFLLLHAITFPYRLFSKSDTSSPSRLSIQLSNLAALHLRFVGRKPSPAAASGLGSLPASRFGSFAASSTSPYTTERPPTPHPHRSIIDAGVPVMSTALILAPLVSVPFMFAAWTIAIFWIFNALINDEGSGRGDGQGMGGILVVWWVWWCKGKAFRK